ncbi:MAG: hypothetical protein GWP05_03365 [Anaerolineaceae bacterium]|nr:hypothetical protein [Anaerolineaceae bacterium]
MFSRRWVILLAWACLLLAAGCKSSKSKSAVERRLITPELVSGSLTVGALPRVYGVDEFVYATPGGVISSDQDNDAGLPLDDRRLIVFAEGSGDSLKGFLYTARLIAESQVAAKLIRQQPLLLLPVRWSYTRNAVAEHLNIKAQKEGAAFLQDIVHAWYLRHGDDPAAGVSLLGFSAGTRVVQMAFGCDVAQGEITATDTGRRPAYMAAVGNVTFVGASISRQDPLPLDVIRGRFINFVNPRDTHFGDRVAFVAPAGAGPVVKHMLSGRSFERSPRFGASVNGFDALPTLTRAAHFKAVDSCPAARWVFRRINFPVPEELVAYGLFGERLENDNLDDFVNLAPNHYIMVGRGPGGATGGLPLAIYRDLATEFVQRFVASALLTGRLPDPSLQSQPRRLFKWSKGKKQEPPVHPGAPKPPTPAPLKAPPKR